MCVLVNCVLIIMLFEIVIIVLLVWVFVNELLIVCEWVGGVCIVLVMLLLSWVYCVVLVLGKFGDGWDGVCVMV